MDNSEVIEMLKEMQLETAKCVGFIEGTVTQAWVIKKLLGERIKKLGGKPYIIKDSQLCESED